MTSFMEYEIRNMGYGMSQTQSVILNSIQNLAYQVRHIL